jgi:hypothetical protein
MYVASSGLKLACTGSGEKSENIKDQFPNLFFGRCNFSVICDWNDRKKIFKEITHAWGLWVLLCDCVCAWVSDTVIAFYEEGKRRPLALKESLLI